MIPSDLSFYLLYATCLDKCHLTPQCQKKTAHQCSHFSKDKYRPTTTRECLIRASNMYRLIFRAFYFVLVAFWIVILWTFAETHQQEKRMFGLRLQRCLFGYPSVCFGFGQWTTIFSFLSTRCIETQLYTKNKATQVSCGFPTVDAWFSWGFCVKHGSVLCSQGSQGLWKGTTAHNFLSYKWIWEREG